MIQASRPVSYLPLLTGTITAEITFWGPDDPYIKVQFLCLDKIINDLLRDGLSCWRTLPLMSLSGQLAALLHGVFAGDPASLAQTNNNIFSGVFQYTAFNTTKKFYIHTTFSHTG